MSYRFTFPVARRLKWLLVLSSISINTLMLALPIATLQIYDRVLPNPGGGTLMMLALGVACAILLESCLRLARARLTISLAHAYEQQENARLVAHVLHSWVRDAQERPSSEYLQALSALGRMKEYALQRLIALAVDTPYIGLFMLALFLVGGVLAMVPLVAVMVFAALMVRHGKVLRAAIAQRNLQDETRYGFLLEALAGAHVMKSMGAEPRFIQRYQTLQQPVTHTGFRIAVLNHQLATGGAMFSQLLVVLVVAAGAPLVIHGSISMGALIACVLLSGRLIQPLQHALSCWMSHQEFENAKLQVERMYALARQPLRVAQEKQEQEPHVTLEHVSLSHDTIHPPILKDVSLTIALGEVVAIRSADNEARSEVLRLLAGFYAPSSGHVRVYGMDPACMTPGLLCQHVAYLGVDAGMLRGTIMENITGFDPAQRERALELSRLIGLDTLVTQLPGGYDTALEGSIADVIPPGLRQRVALVRALRYKPKLILFDQADRSLDREGYHQLFSLIARLKGKATVLLVSDDQNLLRLADRRLLLQGGILHSWEGTGKPELSLVRTVGMA